VRLEGSQADATARSRRPLVSLTPLIDVVFILLVFFMLASSFSTEQVIDMLTPADTQSSPEGPAGAALVRVAPDGSLDLNGEPLSRPELAERVKEQGCLYDIVKLKLQHDAPIPVVLQQIAERLPAGFSAPERAGARIWLPDDAFVSPGFAPAEQMLEASFALPDGGAGRVQVVYQGRDARGEPPAFLAEEQRLLDAVAGHLESFLHRRTAEEALEQSRESYRILAEYSPEWEYWLGPDGRYVYISPACETITGFPPAAFEADSGLLARRLHPADRSRYLAHRDEILNAAPGAQHRDTERLELRLRRRDGAWIWIDHICTPVIGADGRWRGRRGANRDISDRKRAEAEVARMTRLYSTLSAANQAIVRHTSEADLLPEITRVAVEHGGLAACLIHRKEAETGAMIPAAAAYAVPPAQNRPAGRACIPELGRGDGSAAGFGLSMPLKVGGELVGAKTVYSTDPDFFTADVVDLLDEMATDVAFALDHFARDAARARAEQAVKSSERQLTAVFRATRVGIGIIRNRRVVQANEHWFAMTGYPPEEVLGQSTRVYYPDDAEYERVGRVLYDALRETGSAALEARLRHKHGHSIDVLIAAAPLDPADRSGGAVFSAMDITERKRAEEAALARERELAAIFRAAPVGMGLLRDRRILRVNEYMTGLIGCDSDELVGQSARVLYSSDEEFQRVGLEKYDQIASTGSGTVETQWLARDGRQLDVILSSSLVDTADPQSPLVFTALDITPRRQAEQALQESHQRLTEAERLAQLGHWGLEPATGRVTWSQEIYRIFGLDPGQPPPRLDEHGQLFHPDDYATFDALLQRSIAQGEPFEFRLRIRRPDGEIRYLNARGEVSKDDSGEVRTLFGTAQDVTEQHLADEQVRQAAKVFESTADAVMITDAERRLLAVNRAFTDITGYREDEVLGRTPELLQARRRDEALFRAVWDVLNKAGSWRGDVWNRRKDGELYRARMTASTVTGAAGEITNYIVVFSDITALTRSQERIDHLAYHDALTDLPNRVQFRTRLGHGLERAARDGERLAVLLLDLDRFKAINESFGPARGDALLCQMAATLAEVPRPGDTLARLGADEFGLLHEELVDVREAAEVARRLLEASARPQRLGDTEVAMTASLGIAVFPDDGEDVDTLLRHTEIALNRAKQRGPDVFEFFAPAMDEGVHERIRLENLLRQACARGELCLHYQPQVRLADGGLAGAEALLRWHSPELGRVSPADFIPLAEEIGLIGELGHWVVEQACEQVCGWDRAGLHLPRVAVNVSSRQLEGGDLPAQIGAILARTGIDPARLELEVTETAVMRRAEQSLAILEDLQRLGLRLSVDDFGTGYSSLAYLRRLPLQQLKIDKSFIDDLLADTNSQAIARAIIALARSLGLETLAEGVEHAEQADWLRREGCDLVQGYHFSRPVPADELAERWLKAARGRLDGDRPERSHGADTSLAGNHRGSA